MILRKPIMILTQMISVTKIMNPKQQEKEKGYTETPVIKSLLGSLQD